MATDIYLWYQRYGIRTEKRARLRDLNSIALYAFAYRFVCRAHDLPTRVRNHSPSKSPVATGKRKSCVVIIEMRSHNRYHVLSLLPSSIYDAIVPRAFSFSLLFSSTILTSYQR